MAVKTKSMRLGGGGRFAAMTAALMRKGKSKKSAKAIAYSIGARKYGKKKMSQLASTGRKRVG